MQSQRKYLGISVVQERTSAFANVHKNLSLVAYSLSSAYLIGSYDDYLHDRFCSFVQEENSAWHASLV